MSDVVTVSLMAGVLDEVKAVLPVVIPAAVSYLAIRKGISFVFGFLRRA